MKIVKQFAPVVIFSCLAVASASAATVSKQAETTTAGNNGTFIVTAKWTGQPLNLMACAKYLNPLSSARLRTLMGGSSASRGRCYDPNISQLVVLAASLNGHVRLKGQGSVSLTPGTYNITVWPYDFRNLAKTLTPVKITPQASQRKELEFEWPYVEKAVKRGKKTIITLVRKKPIGTGTLKLSANITSIEKPVIAEVNINKLGYRGQESTSFYQYHSYRNGGKPGLALPLSVSLPEGDYRIHVRPYGQGWKIAEKTRKFEIRTGQILSQTFNFAAPN